MNIQAYLFFDGRCEEALDFYRRTVGAQVDMLMRYKESPEPGMVAPGSEDKIMHSELRIGDSVVMASDGQCQGKPRFEGFSLALNCANAAEADRAFGALAEGGQVTMPLAQTFWSPRFGMLTDPFGIGWMINVIA